MHSDQSKRSIVDALRRAWTACAAARSAPRTAQPATRVRSVRLKRLGRRFTARGAVLAVIGGLLPPVFVLAIAVPAAQAASSCPAGGCSVTIDARDFTSQQALPHFNYVINLDNTRFVDPTTQQPKDPFPTYVTTESNSPIVREGDENRNTVHLPAGRYLISVRALDHKMWGSYITLPDDAATDGTLTARIDLTEQSDAHPLPLGKIRVFVFEDNAWTNGAPDTEEARAAGLQGRAGGADPQRGHRRLQQQAAVRRPMPDRRRRAVTINDLGPATYFIDVHPPDRPVQRRPEQPVVPDHHDRRWPAAAGRRRRGQRRHRRARRAVVGAADQPHRVLVRLRLRPDTIRRPRGPARSPARRATGRAGRRSTS